PNAERIWFIRYAMKDGMSVEEIHKFTHIDPWFLHHMRELLETEEELRRCPALPAANRELLLKAKQQCFSDPQLAHIWNCHDTEVRRHRKSLGIEAVFKLVDTCAAEFEAYTPYYYSTYEAAVTQLPNHQSQITNHQSEDETKPTSTKQRIMILGGGPNRIGQGIEFDYCCVQAAFALRDAGFETIMVNSNPETVSPDYDPSDHLFFEPLTTEDVLNICDRMQPAGVIVQFGGQTPLNLAKALGAAGAPIIGTSVESIDKA